MDQGSEISSQPVINKKYKLASPRKTLMERHQNKTNQDNFDDEQNQFRMSNPIQDKGMENCTFSPDISKTARHRQNRSVDDMLDWGEQKGTRRTDMVLQRQEEIRDYFTPLLSNNSRKLVGHRGNAFERLFKEAKDRKKKRSDLVADYNSKLFYPELNANSLRIAGQWKEEHLTKRMEHQDSDVDHFQASLVDSPSGGRRNSPKKSTFVSGALYVPHDSCQKSVVQSYKSQAFPGKIDPK